MRKVSCMSILKTEGTHPSGLGGVLLGVAATSLAMSAGGATPRQPAPEQIARGRANLVNSPVTFEINRGQTDPHVRFLSRSGSGDLFLASNEVVLALKNQKHITPAHRPLLAPVHPSALHTSVIRMHLAGANPDAPVRGEGELPGKSNYFRGRDRSQWVTNVSHYASVRYEGVYSGVDMVYYGQHHRMEYDFRLAAGADPSQIRLSIAGADRVSLTRKGDLELRTVDGVVEQQRPVVYQEVDGVRHRVDGKYVLASNKSASTEVGFQIGEYDHSRPLVIDPVLAWATYLGGSDNDEGNGIALDPDGFIYVVGTTKSVDFPTTSGAWDVNLNGASDAFVSKLTPDGSALVYSTYIGGSGDEQGFGIGVAPSGRAYITGSTTSSHDFPIASPPKANPAQPAYAGGTSDAFVTALEKNGDALFYSTYWGGRGFEKKGDGGDVGYAIAVDGAGNAYVTGATRSVDMVTKAAIQSQYAEGGQDAFVLKLNVLGECDFATYLGGGSQNYLGNTDYGAGVDAGYGFAVVSFGFVFVSGSTSSRDPGVQTNGHGFPVLNALQPNNRSVKNFQTDAFVCKIIPGGKQFMYSTYLGGNSDDAGLAITCDPEGNAYVTGVTRSTNFPCELRPMHGTTQGADDVFVTKLNSAGFQLMCSTYFGGSDNDEGHGIAVDANGDIFIVGATSSVDFPVTRPLQGRFGGLYDTFITKLDPTCHTILYSGYFGIINQDFGYGIALDANGNAYVVGTRFENTNPTTEDTNQTHYGGGPSEAFVAKITDDQVVNAGGRLKAPKSLNCGTCPVHTTVSKFITLKNVGKQTLVGTVRALPAGAFRVDSASGPFTLPPHAVTKIRVYYKADSVSKQNAIIYIDSSDTRHPVTTIQVLGRGKL